MNGLNVCSGHDLAPNGPTAEPVGNQDQQRQQYGEQCAAGRKPGGPSRHHVEDQRRGSHAQEATPARATFAMRSALVTRVSLSPLRKSLRCALTGSRIKAVVSAARTTFVR